jgi:hypothetical protein
MIYVIITTSLINCDYENRKNQYIRSINRIIEITKNKLNYKLVIVENNGQRKTFLDDFGLPVLYTNNNTINTNNKGIKELHDIFDCINFFNIKDDDMIVKLTGRYVVDIDSEVFKILDNNLDNIDCIIKYGWYEVPSDTMLTSCITVLIANRCKDIKKIEMPGENICLEWNWANMTTQYIDITKIHKVNKLGVLIYCNNKHV